MLIGNGEVPKEPSPKKEEKPVDYWLCLVFFLFLFLCLLGVKEIADILIKYGFWW